MDWRGLVDGLWSAWLPEACAACDEVLGEGVEGFCPDCRLQVLELPGPGCERCGEPGAFPRARCPRCLARPPAFAAAWAAFEHEGPVARAIHRFKYQDRSDLARPLAAETARRWPGWLRGDALVPVPLHPGRFRQRRYDQAALLAAHLGPALGLGLELEWLARVRDTPRQVGLDEWQREDNVAGAFAAAPAVRGRRVLLVDDVLTTGATAQEAAATLLAAGARAVAVATVARARRAQP